jgi:hypothetical protein
MSLTKFTCSFRVPRPRFSFRFASACQLGQATEIFRHIDHNFDRWNSKVVGPPIQKTAVQVYEIVKDSTFQDLFGGFGVAFDSLALTHAQIKQFAKRISG